MARDGKSSGLSTNTDKRNECDGETMNLTGRWIGETQGCKTELHYWLLVQQGNTLSLYTRWEGELHLRKFSEWVILGNNSFTIETRQGDFEAALTSPQSFTVPKWVPEWEDNKPIPKYDVVFQRKDTGIKQMAYRMLISFLVSIRTAMRLFGLSNVFSDPVLLIKCGP